MSDEIKPLMAEELEPWDNVAAGRITYLPTQHDLTRLVATIRAAWKERDDIAAAADRATDKLAATSIEQLMKVNSVAQKRIASLEAQLAGQDGVVKHLQSELAKANAAPREVMPDYEVSLRDQLAAAALTGVVARGDTAPQDGFSTYQDAAQEALAYADAMLAERKRREAGR